MRQPIKLTFGETELTIRPLTINQVEAIEDIVTSVRPGGVARAKGILSAALARDHATVVIDDLEAGADDLGAAVSAILRHGGFLELPPGEAKPAGDAPTGQVSAAA